MSVIDAPVPGGPSKLGEAAVLPAVAVVDAVLVEVLADHLAAVVDPERLREDGAGVGDARVPAPLEQVPGGARVDDAGTGAGIADDPTALVDLLRVRRHRARELEPPQLAADRPRARRTRLPSSSGALPTIRPPLVIRARTVPTSIARQVDLFYASPVEHEPDRERRGTSPRPRTPRRTSASAARAKMAAMAAIPRRRMLVLVGEVMPAPLCTRTNSFSSAAFAPAGRTVRDSRHDPP